MDDDRILVIDNGSVLAKDTVRRLNLATMNAVLYPITGVTLGDMIDHAIQRRYRNHKRPAVKCALPGCENITSHRGGYCCSEHKGLHRLIANEPATDCEGEG